MTTSVGVVLVTHNSARFIEETWASIVAQTRPVDRVVVIDDHSSDGTMDYLGRFMRTTSIVTEILPATSTAPDASTRIAHNFTQGVLRLGDCDVIALADHDDVWSADRIARQAGIMRACPEALMLASNGTVAHPPTTLFDAFGVPPDLMSRTPARILRHVLRHSVATGSASMIRRELADLPSFVPPTGWLHDRWWSILAASTGGFLSDTEPVIDYRITVDQEVGLNSGRQRTSGLARLMAAVAADRLRVMDLHRLRGHAVASCAGELAWPRLVMTLGR